MKKFIVYLSCLLLVVSGFIFAPKNSAVYADDLTQVNILSMENGKNYTLTEDIDCSAVTDEFNPLKNYSGTFDGGGHSIKNLTIVLKPGEEKLGFFASTTNGAIIKNIKFENLRIVADFSTDIYVTKVGLLVGEAVGTKISNCEITSSTLTISSVSSVYVGNLVGEARDGTQIRNCLVSADLKVLQQGMDTTKQFFAGGLVGKQSNAQIYNTIVSSTLSVSSKNSEASVGGLVGYVSGDKAKAKNNIFVGDINLGYTDGSTDYSFQSERAGSFVGAVSCPDSTPTSGSLNYFYTSDDTAMFGNEADLRLYGEHVIVFPLDSLIMENDQQTSTFSRQEFYSKAENWDFQYAWNFVDTWNIVENISLPKIQNFQLFSYSVSEDDSFVLIEKPILSSGNNVILFDEDTTFAYNFGGQIVVSGNITTEASLDKFFNITGLRKIRTGEILFDNNEVFAIIDGATAEFEGGKESSILEGSDDEGEYKKYTYQGRSVIARISDDIEKYTEDGITLTIENGDSVKKYSYVIDNCNASDEGEYCFVIEAIKYELKIKTENVDKGTVRRKTADSSIKESLITDSVSYGQRLSYITTPTDDFAFDSWKLKAEEEDVTLEGEDEDIEFVFNEKAFLEGGIFAGQQLGDELSITSYFTKAVCEITFKFAVNNAIVNDNLSAVMVNYKPLTANEDGVYSYKAKMGEKYTISVNLPAGYEFTSWFESDGQANIRDLANTMEMDITASQESETMMVVANFYKEEILDKADTSLLWIIIGSVAGVSICVVVIFVLVRKKKDNSYKSFY